MTNCCRLLCLVAAALGLACSSDGARPSNDAATDTAVTPDTKLPPDGGRDGGPDTTVVPDAGDAGNDGSNPDLQNPDGQNPDLRADGPLTSTRSYIVAGKLTARPANSSVGPIAGIDGQSFSLRLDPVGKTILLGVEGSASRAPVTSTDGQSFSATAPLKALFTTGSYPCGPPQLTFDKFAIQVSGDGLQGTAEGRMDVFMGDVIYGYIVTMTMTGRPDDEGPSFGDDIKNIDPLAGLFLKASEPLPAASTAAITLDSGLRLELEPFSPMDSGGVLTGFHVKTERALRYDATYTLAVTPGSDLAGNAGRKLPKLQTLASPVIAAEDGFEGAGPTLGGTQVVQAPALPPIAGTRSVYLAGNFAAGASAGRRFTVRLAVAPGDKVVRFSLRPVFQFQQTAIPYGSAIRVAVPGGSIVEAPLPGAETPTVRHDSGMGGPPLWLGKTVAIEVGLPADAKDEVVFDAAVGPGGVCGLITPVPGYLIDDLRVE